MFRLLALLTDSFLVALVCPQTFSYTTMCKVCLTGLKHAIRCERICTAKSFYRIFASEVFSCVASLNSPVEFNDCAVPTRPHQRPYLRRCLGRPYTLLDPVADYCAPYKRKNIFLCNI